MKIAIFHNLLSGGAKRSLREAMRWLAKDHKMDVFSYSSANHTFADLGPYAANQYIFPFSPSPLLHSPFGRLNQAIRLYDLARLRAVAKRAAQAVEEKGYDVVFVEPCQYETASSILRFLHKTPSVYYCQEPLRLLYETMPSRPYFAEDLERRRILNRIDPLPRLYYSALKKNDFENIHHASMVLVNSKFVRDNVKQIYDIDARVSYNGVNASLFQPMPERVRKNYFLSVGSLTPLKGFDFLIESIACLPEQLRLPLVIVSNFQNPPEKEYLNQLAEKRCVSVTMLGDISDGKLVELYNEAKLTLYAPIREPFGLVPVESMSCGTPIVGVREGGVPESILHQKTGLLTGRDPRQFAQAIQDMLADPEQCEEFGRAGREHVLQHWTQDIIASNLEGFLAETAQRKILKKGLS